MFFTDIILCVDICLHKFGNTSTQRCLLFATSSDAVGCEEFILKDFPIQQSIVIKALNFKINHPTSPAHQMNELSTVTLYAVFMPQGQVGRASKFFRHAGCCISTRFAEDLLKYAHVAAEVQSEKQIKELERNEADTHLLEKIKQRIANLLERGRQPNAQKVSSKDVFLFQTGMAAHYFFTSLLSSWDEDSRPSWKGDTTVIFGFLYDSSVRLQREYSKDYIFYGFGSDEELSELENFCIVRGGVKVVVCECPSNPLLQTPDFGRLRKFADRFVFLLVVEYVRIPRCEYL